MPARPLAVLCGPTAVGKTALAVALAQHLDAEIVCADSRTVYRGMDIGTAKPSAAARAAVPHHLLDVVDPQETFTVAQFQRLAHAAIADIRRRGKQPLLVGGTGLYIRAVVDDLRIPAVAPDPVLRARLEAVARTRGPEALHGQLQALDPVAASRIHPHNVRRVVRALEVCLATGRPISSQQHRGEPAAVVLVGIWRARADLYRRIETRVDEQLAAGLLEETRQLLAHGVPLDAPAMQGLGYKELAGYLQGHYDYADAVRLLKRNTRRYAKRQLTWFRKDTRIRWVDATGVEPHVLLPRVHAIMETEHAVPGRREWQHHR
ncbi:MAG: tRNA (adenosine(37)-N6)-dimethylallyltransferase MiaA [Armatimonadota bacterium]|nr:tRNA (adenosine(37)-N6)-dimethylallyltransferase MiaA [Armatimonadota bacterium]MDR7532327.1 tRNA (adenosine(37)-N6)-dimethylallyltransferase MiaA [Armatimonadota bacterium]MDR7535254.1 tRNA (adenosine(37)-N6)-dimethylallyltransferase MiaA [Armatimonadota bacterium]